MRQLASIQLVTSAEPIPNADAIERLRVLGWSIVAKKGEFPGGEKVVYCEIDSLLPEWPPFEFLRPSSYKAAIIEGDHQLQRAGFRIRTVKLRGQVSQGICFPLSILPTGTPTEVGTNVTDALQIIKYEPPVPAGMGGTVKGTFPAFLPKTDETRIQVLEPLLTKYRGHKFHMTEKLDGTSFTAFLHKGEFGICSRNQWLDETDESNILSRIAKGLRLREKLEAIKGRFDFDGAIQGEVIGPGIQGNKYGLNQVELHVFNLIDISRYCLVDHETSVAATELVGLKTVPRLGDIILNHSIDELVDLSAGTSILNSKVQREGIVFRPAVEVYEPLIGGRLSFKVINPHFLLKYGE
ncbi:MAG: RNA ligase (ATP) [Planctomyces sp.]|nr:RNA ligase (ATP) [Planctomyces sp.]